MRDTYDRYLLPPARQARGMVSDQVDCGPSDALDRMTALATAVDPTLKAIFDAVLDGSIRFDN